ncbi:hypothetical protein HN587_03225 [Candidatus Woesearchaeota archaeon]|jgi:hypothetical protein|nr:hypothetical protein [Candidatus Woesearchaeota archaeon]
MAKLFRNYFSKRTGVKAELMHLSLVQEPSQVETGSKSRFLEAFRDRIRVSESINGYCVPTEELSLMYHTVA